MAGKTMDKGAISEARFIMEAFKMGWEVAKPFHHSQGYDFVIREKPGFPWETIQVKTAYWDTNGRGKRIKAVSLRRCNEKGSRPYKDGDFCWLFVVDENQCWCIPWSDIKEIKSCICIKSPKYDIFKI